MNLISWNGYWPRSRFSNLDRHLDGNVLKWKSCKLKCKITDCFYQTIFISVSGKKAEEKKKVKRPSKIWKNEIRLIVIRKQNVSWYKPVTLNELNCSCFCHIINILLTQLSRSVWENLDLSCVCRPHCVQSVLMTLVKILWYRPPARLIRAK